MGLGGSPIGHSPRASNNLFRGTCLKKVKKPCCRGFGWVKRAPLGHLVGPWGFLNLKKVKKPRCRGFGWVKRAPLGHLVGPWGARWVPVGPGGPGGMFMDIHSKT